MLDWLYAWLTEFVMWLFGLVKAGFLALRDLLRDSVVWVLDQVFGAVAGIIEAIPLPDFVGTYSAGGLLGGLPDTVLWFVNVFGIGDALILIGSAFAFRLMRKLVTLGQW